MPAYFNTGFSVREVPWHGLGKILEDYPGSWDEARRLAGLDWEPEESGVYDVTELLSDGTAKVQLIDGWKQLRRSDNGHRLAIASGTYEIIPHTVMGEIVEAILAVSDGQVRYETAGSLEDGARVWALARLGDAIELDGDPSPLQPYMALLNSHNGTAALKVIATSVRIVCANTWHLADMDATARGSEYSFRHTKNWKLRVEDAKAALMNTQENTQKVIATARELLSVKINAAQRAKFIEEFAIHRVIANTVAKKPHTKQDLAARLEQPRVQKSLHTTVSTLNRVLDSRTCEGIHSTAWGLVQAAGELADHFRESTNKETYFSRTVLAEKEPLKLAAMRIAREAVATG